MPKNISRYEYGGIEGWLVRLYDDGKERSKLFTDKKYGSKLKARSAAVRYRDLQQAQKRNEKDSERRFIANSERNTSGVIGVSRIEKQERSGKTYGHWQASWRENGKTKTRSFAASKYGEKEARRRAIQARHRAMVRIHGERYIQERENSDLLPSDDEIFNT